MASILLPTLATGIGIPVISQWISSGYQSFKSEATLRNVTLASMVGIAVAGIAFMYTSKAAEQAAAMRMASMGTQRKTYAAGTPTNRIALSEGIKTSENAFMSTGLRLVSERQLNSFPSQPDGWYTEGHPASLSASASGLTTSVITVD